MKRARLPERRHDPRHLLSARFVGRELSLVGSPLESRKILQGEIQNMSLGGLNLLTSQRTRESSLIRGEIVFPNLPVGVPSLMRVCWVRRAGTNSQYRMGLQFVF
jgi:hypothetical protein